VGERGESSSEEPRHRRAHRRWVLRRSTAAVPESARRGRKRADGPPGSWADPVRKRRGPVLLFLFLKKLIK
jgi:hypothetical protein